MTTTSNVLNVSTTFGPLRVTAIDANTIVVDTVRSEYSLKINGVNYSARYYLKRSTSDNVQYRFREIVPGWYWERYSISRPDWKQASSSAHKKAKLAVAEALTEAFAQGDIASEGARVAHLQEVERLQRDIENAEQDLQAMRDKLYLLTSSPNAF